MQVSAWRWTRSCVGLLQVTLGYGTVYLLFMWVYHDASSHWVYDVLDWTKPWAIPLYLPLPLLLFAAFMFW